MRLGSIAAVALAATLAATFVAAPASGGAEGKRSGFERCGKVDLGFTDAKIRARGMSCSGAKGIFNKWRREVNCPNKPCERTRVENFVCRFGGSDLLVKLDCGHVRNRKAIKARWGG